jgi:hypothetical protein
MAAISTFRPIIELNAWQTGATIYVCNEMGITLPNFTVAMVHGEAYELDSMVRKPYDQFPIFCTAAMASRVKKVALSRIHL